MSTPVDKIYTLLQELKKEPQTISALARKLRLPFGHVRSILYKLRRYGLVEIKHIGRISKWLLTEEGQKILDSPQPIEKLTQILEERRDSVTLAVTLPPDLYDRIRTIASHLKMSEDEVVRRILLAVEKMLDPEVFKTHITSRIASLSVLIGKIENIRQLLCDVYDYLVKLEDDKAVELTDRIKDALKQLKSIITTLQIRANVLPALLE